MSEISKHSTLSDLQLLSQLLEPIFYYDVFQHPLRLEEIHQYANCQNLLELAQTSKILNQATKAGYLFVNKGFYQLTENPISVQKRIENNQRANKYIKRAQRISKFMLMFPFVRAVFVSGSLSKNVMPQDGDIDYFIVTKPGRLWIARTFLILFKKIFLFNSYKYFCVNYFVDEKMLEIEEKKSLYCYRNCNNFTHAGPSDLSTIYRCQYLDTSLLSQSSISRCLHRIKT